MTPFVGTLSERMFSTRSQRREFLPEHKDEAVKLVINAGRPIARVARELGQGTSLGSGVPRNGSEFRLSNDESELAPRPR